MSLPSSFQLDNYKKAFDKLDLATTFTNTFLYTAVSVLILALLCGTTAWAIARCRARFFKFCYIYFIVGILIPYQALFLPIYIIGYRLKLTNTRYGIIFMYVATGISFGVFLMNSFMSTVPIELEEAARIDGSREFRTFNQIVLPIMKPAMAVQAIFTFVGSWNNYFVPALVIQSKEKMTVPILIALLRGADYMNRDMGKIYMMIMVAIVPIVLVYLILSKYIIAGVTLGGVKG